MDESNKDLLRKAIKNQKKAFARKALDEWSDALWEKFEDSPLFRQASTVLLYHSLPDEVDTHKIIAEWSKQKDIILPVVVGSELELRRYTGLEHLRVGSYQIEEPDGCAIEREDIIDLALIPGVSFDFRGNRLGRGKGFYDKLLKRIAAPKVGICFHFQLRENLPVDSLDVPMDQVWSERGRIF